MSWLQGYAHKGLKGLPYRINERANYRV